MFAIPDVSTMSSTIVERVSIDYSDFSDSFLTCGTCLCQYDAEESTPKLLPCSHTVCRSCLQRIVDASRDNTQVRCPICRESVAMPRGGVAGFPPSFLVNQLLDLMARQRRDVIPKCSEHMSQELLFCETCDAVFCSSCTGGAHNGGTGRQHTVIPFSTAIKRMSEILLYKAGLCLRHLARALEAVAAEMDAVECSAEKAAEAVNVAFSDVTQAVESRRHDVLGMLRRLKEEKQRVLKEQLDIISVEKAKVESECAGLQQQIEVRNITRKISDLNDKLDVSTTLAEPRENAFLKFQYMHNAALDNLMTALDDFGRIKISKTFPALCSAELSPATIHLKHTVSISTVDYHGNPRTSGADPVSVELVAEDGSLVDTDLFDNDDGTYTIDYVPDSAGEHTLHISIFGRPIRDSPFMLAVSPHNNPLLRAGERGSGAYQFIQPVAVVVDQNQRALVLDTGNSRIQALHTEDLGWITSITGPGLQDRGATGMAIVPGTNDVMLVNWRTQHVTQLNNEGDTVKKFTCSQFSVPTSVAINQQGDVYVADTDSLLAFDASGRFVQRFGGGAKGSNPRFRQIACVYCHDDLVYVADATRVWVLGSGSGKLSVEREIRASTSSGGQYGGVVADAHGNLLVTRQEKGKCVIHVFDDNYRLRFTIDSNADPLSRPAGLAVTEDGHVIVTDLGNDCIKKYRYI